MKKFILLTDRNLAGDKQGVVIASGDKMPPNGYADEIRDRLDRLADEHGYSDAVEYVKSEGEPGFFIAEVTQKVRLTVPKAAKILCTRVSL